LIKSLPLVFLTLVLLASFGTGLSLADGAQLMVDPARIEALVSPNKPINGAITVVNTGSDTLRLSAEVRDWEMTTQGEPIFSRPQRIKNSSAGWIRFNPRVFQLGAGKSQIVRYSIAAPKGSESGEYRSAIIFAVEPSDPVKSSLTVSGNIVTTVYANVGPVKRQGIVLSSQSSYSQSMVYVRTLIKSSGNAHLRLSGSFRIINAGGQTVGEGVYAGGVIFPGRERVMNGLWRGSLTTGKYCVESFFQFKPSLYAHNMSEYDGILGLKASSNLVVE
jgi:hypothetical protein